MHTHTVSVYDHTHRQIAETHAERNYTHRTDSDVQWVVFLIDRKPFAI